MIRRMGAFIAVASVGVLIATAASAHVTVNPSEVQKASFPELSFRVPNEEDSATTTALSIQLPTDHPIASVSVEAIPGWTFKTKTTHLATPIKNDDGDAISDVISEIDWTSDANSAIKAGEYKDFPISLGPIPDGVTELKFPAIQTYSNGDVVSWIEATPASGQEPDHPVPTLKVTSASTSHTTADAAKPKDKTARILAVVAIALSVAALASTHCSSLDR